MGYKYTGRIAAATELEIEGSIGLIIAMVL
jgi:hypothetical protein